VDTETEIREVKDLSKVLLKAKQNGFSDYQIGYITGKSELEIRKLRKRFKIVPRTSS